jgi:hypothetical protein
MYRGAMSSRSWLCLVLLSVGCWRTTPPSSPTPSEGAVTVADLLTIRPEAFGPITANTEVSERSLGALFGPHGLTVEVVPDRHGDLFHVSRGDELMFYVVTDAGNLVFNIHAVSREVTISMRPEWKIGAPFTGHALLTECECWGERPVCFRKGEHVAVAFERECDGLEDEAGRSALDGERIQRAVWSPNAFGVVTVDDAEAGVPADDHVD